MPGRLVRMMAWILLGTAGLALLGLSGSAYSRAHTATAINDGSAADLMTVAFIAAPIGLVLIGLATWVAFYALRDFSNFVRSNS